MNNPFEEIEERLDRIEKMLEPLTRQQPTIEPSDKIDLHEAIKITGLSKSSIYKLSFLNNIPVKKFGRRLIFSRQELLAWIEKNTHTKNIALQSAKQLQIAAAKKRI